MAPRNAQIDRGGSRRGERRRPAPAASACAVPAPDVPARFVASMRWRSSSRSRSNGPSLRAVWRLDARDSADAAGLGACGARPAARGARPAASCTSGRSFPVVGESARARFGVREALDEERQLGRRCGDGPGGGAGRLGRKVWRRRSGLSSVSVSDRRAGSRGRRPARSRGGPASSARAADRRRESRSRKIGERSLGLADPPPGGARGQARTARTS